MSIDVREHPDRFVMSIGDHLEDLRRRIMLALVVPLPISIVLFLFSEPIIDVLARPLTTALRAQDLPQQMQTLTPIELLATRIKLSLIAAIVIAIPWILWQAWLFIRPGLYVHERRFVRFLIPGSAVLTTSGALLMYYVMLPLVLLMLLRVGSSASIGSTPNWDREDVQAIIATFDESAAGVPDRIEMPGKGQVTIGDAWKHWNRLYVVVDDGKGNPEILHVGHHSETGYEQKFRLSWYITFVLMLLLGICIAFQLPLVLLLLGWMGLVTPNWLASKRKYALGACGVLSALVTPPDVLSMLLMMFPLYGLFELGILLMRIVPSSKVAEGRVFSLRTPSESIARGPRDDDGPGP